MRLPTNEQGNAEMTPEARLWAAVLLQLVADLKSNIRCYEDYMIKREVVVYYRANRRRVEEIVGLAGLGRGGIIMKVMDQLYTRAKTITEQTELMMRPVWREIFANKEMIKSSPKVRNNQELLDGTKAHISALKSQARQMMKEMQGASQ